MPRPGLSRTALHRRGSAWLSMSCDIEPATAGEAPGLRTQGEQRNRKGGTRGAKVTSAGGCHQDVTDLATTTTVKCEEMNK